jgi:metallo-beta-lactamase family protein
MTIQFFGAARTVTGSKHLITIADGTQILLDCGLFQGINTDELNQQFGFDPAAVDYMVLSHAHIDHTGLIPRLVAQGFRGPIYTTSATIDLCEVMLMDSARIQVRDLERVNSRRSRRGEPELDALYNEADVEHALTQMVAVDYNKPFSVGNSVTGLLTDAGHLLGSAAISLTIRENDRTTQLAFSGDIGRPDDKILRTPAPFPLAD